MWFRNGCAALSAAAAAATLGLQASPAQACGGFFCSQAAPVQQSAEEIIFIDNPDDTVTAIIRIEYAGPAAQFAWVLPIKGAPSDVGVSSEQAFARLRNVSEPQYVLNTTVEGECMDGRQFGNGSFPMGPGASSPDPSVAEDGGVSVVAQGTVGPFDWTVINVDPQLTDPADVAVDWLVDNSYDVTALGPEVLRPYLQDGLNLMAFKLTKGADADVGSIRPVVITYEGATPSIPIRPTAVAAQADMGIRVWVLGSAQAVPVNYKSLVLNEALINWFDYRSTYRGVVTAAADEAGGQGFVTEMAGSTSQLDQQIFSNAELQQWMQYSLTPFTDGFDMIQQATWQYRGWDGWRDVVCGALTLPDGVTCTEFGQSPESYRGSVQIDQHKFLVDLYEDVIRPVIDTQELLVSRAYFTRLFSTMSPDEMTTDPAFDFNADLADVSNLHTAEQVIECSPDVAYYQAPWRIELPQGGVIRGKGQNFAWPFALDALPANVKIVQLGTSGAGRVLEDNSEMIGDALFEQSNMTPTGIAEPEPPPRGVPIGGGDDDMPGSGSDPDPDPSEGGAGMGASADAPSGSGGGLCAVSRAGAGKERSAGALALGVALALWFRRRRSAHA